MLLEKCLVMRFWNPDPGLLKPIVVNSSINYRICQLTLGVEEASVILLPMLLSSDY